MTTPWAPRCICGATLYGATNHGVWTLEWIACEYRTCGACGSTRAYMPPDIIAEKNVRIMHGDQCVEHVSLLDALDQEPAWKDQTIERGEGRILLAKVFESVNGDLGWLVMAPHPEDGP